MAASQLQGYLRRMSDPKTPGPWGPSEVEDARLTQRQGLVTLLRATTRRGDYAALGIVAARWIEAAWRRFRTR